MTMDDDESGGHYSDCGLSLDGSESDSDPFVDVMDIEVPEDSVPTEIFVQEDREAKIANESKPEGETLPVVTPSKAKTRSKYSIAHEWIDMNLAVLFHIDIEHAGDEAGIVQLSVVATDQTGHEVLGEFDRYVRPPEGAKWCTQQMNVHNIHPSQDRIKNASNIVEVWHEFTAFVESKLDEGCKRGILAAWSGKGCDVDYLYKIVHELHPGECVMPKWCPYFMDPKEVISHYKTCHLHGTAPPAGSP